MSKVVCTLSTLITLLLIPPTASLVFEPCFPLRTAYFTYSIVHFNEVNNKIF
jgi:hypothetical protein